VVRSISGSGTAIGTTDATAAGGRWLPIPAAQDAGMQIARGSFRGAAVALVVVAAVAGPGGGAAAAERPGWALVIHGGAGRIVRDEMPEEVAAMLRARLSLALREGRRVLADGGDAVAAVGACVVAMEDDRVFNAGRGAVLTARGEVELDASIMAGDGRRAGAVAGVRRTRNPILAAAAVMEHSKHVLFAGEGADAFAEARGLLIRSTRRRQVPAPPSGLATTRRSAGPPHEGPGSGRRATVDWRGGARRLRGIFDWRRGDRGRKQPPCKPAAPVSPAGSSAALAGRGGRAAGPGSGGIRSAPTRRRSAPRSNPGPGGS